MGVGNHHRGEYAVEKIAGAVEAGIPTPDLEGRERKQSLIQRALAESEHLAVAVDRRLAADPNVVADLNRPGKRIRICVVAPHEFGAGRLLSEQTPISGVKDGASVCARAAEFGIELVCPAS